MTKIGTIINRAQKKGKKRKELEEVCFNFKNIIT
ncbi:hypothetical protein NC652_009778 [Populus alba x Populus x berolinensis]|nr:hypothetical protein NC652_009778 [Populus alba x Populus x berolinensis]